MKRYFLILLLTALSIAAGKAHAAGIKFLESKAWKEVLAEAKRSNKPIFLDAYATWCGPCKYLQKDVFTDGDVGAFFNANFISVKIDMEKGEGPDLSDEFGVDAYPTLLFFNPQGKLVHKFVGAMGADEFVELGKDALDPGKQYYTLADKAKAYELKPDAFHDWVHMAEKMEEQGLEEIVAGYLENGPYKMDDKDMMELLIDHLDYPGADLVRYMQDNKALIMNIAGISEGRYAESLKEKVVGLATKKAIAGDDFDYEVFYAEVAAFLPADAKTETQLMRVKFNIYDEEPEQAVDELVKLLTDRQYSFKIASLGVLLVNKGDELSKATNVKALLTAIGSYKLKADENNQGFYKDYCLMILSYFMDDMATARKLADKVLADTNVTEEVRQIAQEVKAG